MANLQGISLDSNNKAANMSHGHGNSNVSGNEKTTVQILYDFAYNMYKDLFGDPDNIDFAWIIDSSVSTKDRSRTNVKNDVSKQQDSSVTSQANHSELKLFHCEYCAETWSDYYSLQQHNRVHTARRPFLCSFCGKTFSRTGCHERTHTGSKSCDNPFSQSDSLRVHERTHTGSKPIHCKSCDKAFSQFGNLRVHERTHTGSKPFQCKFCDTTFSNSSNLRVHERTRNGSKPFQCKFCDKVFSRSGDLRVHERTHTGSKPLV